MALEIDDGSPAVDTSDSLDLSELDLGNDFAEDDTTDAEIENEDDGQAADTDTDTDAESDDPASAGADADLDTDGGDGQAEPDESEQEDAPAGDPKPAKDPLIPKARLDQALRARRAAEQEAQELKARIAEMEAAQLEANAPKPMSPQEIQDLMKRANEALVDGRVEDAAALQAEALAALAPRPVQAKPANTSPDIDPVDALEARVEFRSMIKDIYERFPEFDEHGESFNEELSQEALDLTDLYVGRGYSTAEAVKKAAENVAKIHELSDRKAVPAKPAAKVLQDAKTRAKVEKATKAPPAATGKARAEGNERLDPARMTEAELMALPASVLNKILGNAF